MSRPHEGNIKAAVMQCFTVLLLSLGLSLTVLKALLPMQAIWPAALLCAVFSLAFEGLYLLPLKKKWILPLALAAGMGVWGALGGGPVHVVIQLAKAAFLSLQGLPDAAAPYADAARWSVCLLFTLLAAALAWDDTLPLAVFSVVTILAMVFILSAQEHLLLYALPAAMGLVLMMAQGREKRLSPLPLAVLLTVVAFLLVPAKTQTVPQLEKIATDIRQFVEDYLLFNEFRSSFSLATEGYQPLENRLGGPAKPEDHTVMEVQTSRTVLLKGKTYNEYSGLNWYDTLSTRRYLYASPRFAAMRNEIFDLNRPLIASDLTPESIQVHLLNNGTTTLFAPAFSRSLQMESERMVLYFNSASELFITRDLQAGDRYALTYTPYIAGSRAAAAVIEACQNRQDEHFAEVKEAYLALPRHIQQEIYDIADRAAGSAATPYEKALNIMNYLRKNYRYNLDVKEPPEGVDFVAWFLIGEKEGYCTYFATAMTVLCRIEGIPARYVTGYIAAPDQNGVAMVTGQHAHAWTEVYLNGFGWLALDATPRSDTNASGDPDGDGQTPPAASPTPPPATPTPAPPESTPTPAPTTAPSESPEQTADDENPPTPTPVPDSDPASPADRLRSAFGGFWWILLILLILLLALRCYLTEPLRKAARKPDQAAEILFAAIAALLAKRGLRKRPQETLHEFAARSRAPLAAARLPDWTPLADQLGGQLYGNHPADPAPFRRIYETLRGAAKPWTRLMLALKRTFTFGRKSVFGK